MFGYKLADRKLAYRRCASELGWHFKEEGDPGMIKWLLDFELCKKGGHKKILPLIIMENDDLAFSSLFDYRYTVSTGKSSVTFQQTVFFRYSKELALPHFTMVPEKWYHKLGTMLGMQDIDFVQYPVFSNNYLLQGKDEEYIRYHFDHPEMINFFGKQNFYSLEGVNYLMILYIHNVILPPEEMLRLIRIGNTLHHFLSQKTPSIELPEDLLMEPPRQM